MTGRTHTTTTSPIRSADPPRGYSPPTGGGCGGGGRDRNFQRAVAIPGRRRITALSSCRSGSGVHPPRAPAKCLTPVKALTRPGGARGYRLRGPGPEACLIACTPNGAPVALRTGLSLFRPTTGHDGAGGKDASLTAMEEAITAGIGVNVTLLFSDTHYLRTADAYLRALERRRRGRRPSAAGSVGIHLDQEPGPARHLLSRPAGCPEHDRHRPGEDTARLR
jgi:hypothetical protein